MTTTPPVDPTKRPAPEWDMVTIKWLGRVFTGAVTGGELTLAIDRKEAMLYDDPVSPVTILPETIRVPLTTTTLTDGAGEAREYMYVAVNVPASDDPDIIGTGFTYTASIKLASGGTYGPFTFTVPHDTPGGVVWLNKVAAAEPAEGELLPQITVSEFVAALDRIAALEGAAGDGPGPWLAGVYPPGFGPTPGSSGTRWRKRGDLVDVYIGRTRNSSGVPLPAYTTACSPPATGGPWALLDSSISLWPVNIASNGVLRFGTETADGEDGPSESASLVVTYPWTL